MKVTDMISIKKQRDKAKRDCETAEQQTREDRITEKILLIDVPAIISDIEQKIREATEEGNIYIWYKGIPHISRWRCWPPHQVGNEKDEHIAAYQIAMHFRSNGFGVSKSEPETYHDKEWGEMTVGWCSMDFHWDKEYTWPKDYYKEN